MMTNATFQIFPFYGTYTINLFFDKKKHYYTMNSKHEFKSLEFRVLKVLLENVEENQETRGIRRRLLDSIYDFKKSNEHELQQRAA